MGSALPTLPTTCDYQLREWTSGTRGACKVPQDFHWPSNPKQAQEEFGAADAIQPLTE